MKTIYNCLNKQYTMLSVIALCAFFASSCTKNFEKYNTDPNKATAAQLQGDFKNIAGYLPNMQLNIITTVNYNFQVQQNLNADIFSGYMMADEPFDGLNNDTYHMRPDWNSTAFDLAYSNIMNNWNQVRVHVAPSQAHFLAVATILKVEGMHRVTDIYGPLPYSKFATNPFSTPYDTQQSIYSSFFNELDTAVNVLTNFVKANPGAVPFKPFDLVYGGDYTQWIKFANTLRLRLAMRIVYADAALAQKEAEAAVNNPYGLLAVPADDANINMVNSITYHNPLWSVCYEYFDINMGAPMESILTGYKDPRLAAYFVPSTIQPGVYKGIRIGIDIPNASLYSTFSLLNLTSSTPIQLMTASEAYFLRAEGALRGWAMGGTAQSFYEQGIQTSFTQHGVSSSGYVNDATSTAASYVDPNNAANNISASDNTQKPYLNNITIKWDATATFEQNLQRIITQKWIACFPDGEEAWSEFRRTGYPKLFPVVINNSGGTISTTAFIKRLPFPSDELTNNPAGVAQGISELGGPDNGGTRLWWDKNPNVQ
jgi:hypothetical protein